YLQLALGYSPAVAGALTLPTVAMAPFLAGSVGRMTDRIGTRTLTAGSMLLAAFAIGLIWLLADHRSVLLLLPAFFAFGIARPIATIAGAAGTVGGISRDARGLATSLITESRQLGAVFGVAVLGLILTALEISRRNHLLLGVDSSFGHRRREVLDGILSGSTAYQPEL